MVPPSPPDTYTTPCSHRSTSGNMAVTRHGAVHAIVSSLGTCSENKSLACTAMRPYWPPRPYMAAESCCAMRVCSSASSARSDQRHAAYVASGRGRPVRSLLPVTTRPQGTATRGPPVHRGVASCCGSDSPSQGAARVNATPDLAATSGRQQLQPPWPVARCVIPAASKELRQAARRCAAARE